MPEPLQRRAQQSIQPGFDFSKIRIYNDGAAAVRHNAAAYAIGTTVVWGRDTGTLTSPEDMRVLGHELAHVVQQSRGGSRTTPPLPAHPLEQSAERAGQAFAAGMPGRVDGGAQVGVARTPKSLAQTVVPSLMSDVEIRTEIEEIRTWLRENLESSSERTILEQAMAALENEAHSRQPGGSTAAPQAPPAVAATAGCPTGMCHQPSGRQTLTPGMLPATQPTPAEIEAIRRWLQSDTSQQEATATPASPTGASFPPGSRWVPIVQHMHLGTFGDTVVTVTAPWQGAVQTAPDPSAGYNFDIYITNPRTGALIPAQHIGGTRYRVFMGTPECPGCHFGAGLQVDILGENPILIFGPTLAMTGSQLLASRMAPLAAAETTAVRPAGPGFTPRVIQGGGTPAVGPSGPAVSGNLAFQLEPTVAQAPRASLQLVPSPAPVVVEPPVILPNPALPAAAVAAAHAPRAIAGAQQAPVMPAGLSRAEQEQWRTCNELHNTYKATQGEAARLEAGMGPIADKLHNNRATPQERVDYCNMLDQRIALLQREHGERTRYVQLGCDRFDWFNQGRTEAERRADHEEALAQLHQQLQNFYALRNRFCP